MAIDTEKISKVRAVRNINSIIRGETKAVSPPLYVHEHLSGAIKPIAGFGTRKGFWVFALEIDRCGRKRKSWHFMLPLDRIITSDGFVILERKP